MKRVALIVAWFSVLALAGFFWLQLQWARMNADIGQVHLGRASLEMQAQGEELAKCQLLGVAGKPAPRFKESP